MRNSVPSSRSAKTLVGESLPVKVIVSSGCKRRWSGLEGVIVSYTPGEKTDYTDYSPDDCPRTISSLRLCGGRTIDVCYWCFNIGTPQSFMYLEWLCIDPSEYKY